MAKKIMKEFRLDEISAVDSPAQVGAKATIMKRDFNKGGALTSEMDGHSHIVSLNSSEGELNMGQTSYTEHSGSGHHSHPWVRTASGEIVIGMAAGHTHTIQTLSKADAGSPGPAAASNQASGNSTADPIGSVQNEVHMTEKNEKTAGEQAAVAKMAELERRAARAEAISEMSEAQRGLFKSLDADGQDKFLAMTAEGRNTEVAKAAEVNKVVYTDALGVEYRKNDDPRLVALAKRADAEATARIAAETAAKEESLAKRALEFGHIPGDIKPLLKAIDAMPVAEREGALSALRAQNANLGTAFREAGVAKSAETATLETIAKRIKAEQPSLTIEQAMSKALDTPEGSAAYAKSIGL